MSDRFERAILDWYNHSRTANLEYLDLSSSSNIKLSDLENNVAVIYDRLLLLSKVSIKQFREIKNQNQRSSERLESCENLLRKTQSETRKSFTQISSEVHQTKPLTKKEVLELVREISQQPKLVEEEALKLSAELNSKVKQVEQQIQRVEHLLKEVQSFLTAT